MADLPTPDDCARLILSIFKHFDARAGHVLRENNFVSVAAKNPKIKVDDLNLGLPRAEELGWIEPGPSTGTYKLTDAGFAAM